MCLVLVVEVGVVVAVVAEVEVVVLGVVEAEAVGVKVVVEVNRWSRLVLLEEVSRELWSMSKEGSLDRLALEALELKMRLP